MSQQTQRRLSMFTLSVREPWLEEIRTGRKIVEGRAGSINKFTPYMSHVARFYSSHQTVLVRIITVRHYDTLYDYLDGEGWQNVAPHLHSRAETVDAYHKFYSDERIRQVGGMNALVIEVV